MSIQVDMLIWNVDGTHLSFKVQPEALLEAYRRVMKCGEENDEAQLHQLWAEGEEAVTMLANGIREYENDICNWLALRYRDGLNHQVIIKGKPASFPSPPSHCGSKTRIDYGNDAREAFNCMYHSELFESVKHE